MGKNNEYIFQLLNKIKEIKDASKNRVEKLIEAEGVFCPEAYADRLLVKVLKLNPKPGDDELMEIIGLFEKEEQKFLKENLITSEFKEINKLIFKTLEPFAEQYGDLLSPNTEKSVSPRSAMVLNEILTKKVSKNHVEYAVYRLFPQTIAENMIKEIYQ